MPVCHFTIKLHLDHRHTITLAGSKLVADHLRTCLRPASNQLRTSFEPDSVMEFGFKTAAEILKQSYGTDVRSISCCVQRYESVIRGAMAACSWLGELEPCYTSDKVFDSTCTPITCHTQCTDTRGMYALARLRRVTHQRKLKKNYSYDMTL